MEENEDICSALEAYKDEEVKLKNRIKQLKAEAKAKK